MIEKIEDDAGARSQTAPAFQRELNELACEQRNVSEWPVHSFTDGWHIPEAGGIVPASIPAPRLSYRAGRTALFTGRVMQAAARTFWKLAAAHGREQMEELSLRLAAFSRSRTGRGELSLSRALARLGRETAVRFSSVFQAFLEGGAAAGFAECRRLVRQAFEDLRTRHARLLQCLAPVAGAAVLGLTLYFWSNVSFALAVSYNGQTVGYVASEAAYRQAVNKLEDQVQNASGARFAFAGAPVFKLALAQKSDLSAPDAMADRLADVSGGEVVQAYGLYVDNRLAGAVKDEQTAEAALDGILNAYRSDAANQQVSFTQQVSIRRGLFPQSVSKTEDQLKETLLAKGPAAQTSVDGMSRIALDGLYAMREDGRTADQVSPAPAADAPEEGPMLSVSYVRDETSTQPIPFEVQNIPTDSLAQGVTKVRTAGVPGQMSMVNSVTYKDGAAVSSSVKSSSVTAAPVAQQVLVGTKAPSSSKKSASGSSAARTAAAMSAAQSGNLISVAESMVGARYRTGGTSAAGFDCSGFTQYVYGKLGISLDHSAAGQSQTGAAVSKGDLEAGDLVFFDTNGGKRGVNHVGIYIGGGQFVAANSGGVQVASMDAAYWSRTYMSARRVK